ncbi:MAG: AAA family ATPase [Solirubrobacteraceae bacterium]
MSAGGLQPADALLERDHELSVLGGLLTSVASRGQGDLVMVGGEAGAGKTALLRRFCEIEGTRARVLWGRCEPLHTPRPLGPLMDIAEATGGELKDLLSRAPRPHEVVAALLAELRTHAPTVLVLEDVHWADEATLDALALLAGRVAAAPALALVSYRDDELGNAAQLQFVLGELVRRPRRLRLERLSFPAVAILAAQRGLNPDELYRSTGGNPFFVTEIVAAAGQQIPETVRDAVLARAARLSSSARRLLDAASVVPGQIEPWLLEALAGELGDRVDECLACGMLIAGPAHVAFRHELARLAVENAIAQNRRLVLHRTAIDALSEAEIPDFAHLAHHADAAGDAEGVLRWAPAAAELAARSGAHREAAAHYARALRFADRLPLDGRADLLDRRVEECRLSAQFKDAIQAQQEALDCRRGLGDGLGEGNAVRALSRLLFFTGRTREGELHARHAVELLEQLSPGHELAMAYANLSQRRMVTEDFAEAVSWGERALELARELSDVDVEIYALTNIGAAELDREMPEGRSKLECSMTQAHDRGLEESVGRAGALLTLCGVRNRDFSLAEAFLEATLEYCTERGLDTWRSYLLAYRARIQLDRGHWDKAAEHAAVVARDPRSAPVARIWALPTLGLVRARRGDADANQPLEEARALSAPTDELLQIVPAAAALAEASWLAGESAAVERVTDAPLGLARRRQSRWAIGELAFWRWQAGLHDKLPADARRTPYGLAITGKPRQAAEAWTELGCPYESALSLSGSPDLADAQRALDELHRLGARPAATIVARRLRERGLRGLPRGPRSQTSDNPGGLTARELEVLTLLGRGWRNAQIAQHLVVSERTVDHHVSAVLRKLNVRSRGEAWAEATRLGLPTPSELQVPR